MRDELLDVEEFSGLAEAPVVVGDWREDYNQRRPPQRARGCARRDAGRGRRADLPSRVTRGRATRYAPRLSRFRHSS